MKRINKHLWLFMMATVILGITWSCQTDENEVTPQPGELTFLAEADQEGMIQIGEKLENPYSVGNMQKAWELLLEKDPNGRTAGKDIVRTTHLYIRFVPKDSAELELLEADTTIMLWDYPLDYEITEGGDFYHDPELPIEQPTYQYCAVEVGKKLPGVEYQLLAELYLPEEDEELGDEVENGRTTGYSIVDDLLAKAFEITGNADDLEPNKAEGLQNAKWNPSGRVRVWDDRAKRYVPVIGCKVRARRWFRGKDAHTDANGNYRIGKFRSKRVNYSIRWERYHFSIRSGTFGQAWLNGPKKKRRSWNVDLGRKGSTRVTDKQQYYALIHQAAYDYYYGNRFGLASPPRNSSWKPQVKISASQTHRQHDKRSHAAAYARTGGIFPSVYIRQWNRTSDNVYAVTCHELAHLAHWDMDRSAFRSLVVAAWAPFAPYILLPGREKYAAVIESWGQGVEWQFAQQRYRNRFGIGRYEYEDNLRINGVTNGNYQAQTISGDPIYTSIVVDLMDTENQRNTTGKGSTNIPLDRVSGYTIRQIEQSLKGARSWKKWRDNLRDQHINGSENRLNELFANWHK
ncbi:MAG: hypothetical protein MJA30_02000 [Cytophagales bacterium]|nr:hypothetical protein [Cytophagales bacterium]